MKKSIDVLIQTEKPSVVLETIKLQYHEEILTPSQLGAIFLAYVSVIGWEDEANGISPEVTIDDLCKINTNFRSTNGCQWARSDNSALGKVYKIVRTKKKNAVYSVKLDGFNTRAKRNRAIRKDIVDAISKQRCVVLDVGVNIEVDHKNGRYDDENVANLETQTLDDFQPLSKAANDAKRTHCTQCLKVQKRYNAQRLGYSAGWTQGDENDSVCVGCYWYDPKDFNGTISKDFQKP